MNAPTPAQPRIDRHGDLPLHARNATLSDLAGMLKVRAKVAEITAQAGREVEQPEQTVRHVAKTLRFDQDAADGILSHFIKGGQTTAGGVMQAVTSFAQTLDDGDAAAEMEAAALDALALAAR